jgi:uncharacterized protein DUF3485
LKSKHRYLGRGIWLWPTISLLMLAGMVAESRTHLQASEATPHLQRCRDAVKAVPYIIQTTAGAWVGRDVEVPRPAIELLHPNAILSREYVNDQEREVVSLLIVNCSNAADLMGHYPPNCYPSQGKEEIKEDTVPRTWHLPHMDINGMEYHFAAKSPTDQEQVVYNFFVMPLVPSLTVSHKELDGVICPDKDCVDKSGEDYQRTYYGAAEFQLVTGPQMTPQQRDQALLDLLSPCENLLLTLENRSSGGKPL